MSVVVWRRGRAEAGDARYCEWFQGVPEGERNAYALMLSAGVVASLPTVLGETRVRDEVRSLLRLIVPESWLSAEWEGTADRSVVGRYLAAPELGQATRDGPRHTYSKSTISAAVVAGVQSGELVWVVTLRLPDGEREQRDGVRHGRRRRRRDLL